MCGPDTSAQRFLRLQPHIIAALHTADADERIKRMHWQLACRMMMMMMMMIRVRVHIIGHARNNM
eukprot:COSAG05_NODE_188_length_14697_cov_11.861145_11_plen_65_part_00